LPFGRDIGDYDQIVLAQDVSFAWHHLQLWAEFHEARFEVPNLGNAETFGYFIEAQYKITPQLFGALRWNQQFFNEVPNGDGTEAQWSRDISRVEVAIGYRFTIHTQLKLQYYVDYIEEAPRNFSHTFAAQFTVRF
jgi:predicted porin